jgi:hypothetical protein
MGTCAPVTRHGLPARDSGSMGRMPMLRAIACPLQSFGGHNLPAFAGRSTQKLGWGRTTVCGGRIKTVQVPSRIRRKVSQPPGVRAGRRKKTIDSRPLGPIMATQRGGTGKLSGPWAFGSVCPTKAAPWSRLGGAARVPMSPFARKDAAPGGSQGIVDDSRNKLRHDVRTDGGGPGALHG